MRFHRSEESNVATLVRMQAHRSAFVLRLHINRREAPARKQRQLLQHRNIELPETPPSVNMNEHELVSINRPTALPTKRRRWRVVTSRHETARTITHEKELVMIGIPDSAPWRRCQRRAPIRGFARGKLPPTELMRTAVATAKPTTFRRARHLPLRQTKALQLKPNFSESASHRATHGSSTSGRHRRHLHDRHRQHGISDRIRAKQHATLYQHELKVGRSHAQCREHSRRDVRRTSSCASDV